MENQIIVTGMSTDQFVELVMQRMRQELQALPKPEKVKPYLSIEEVCELLDLSKQTVYTLTHKKEIPHIKRGAKLLFNRAAIIQWLEDSAQPTQK